MNRNHTPQHRSTEQTTPTRPATQPEPPKHRGSLGLTLSERLAAVRAS